MAEYEQITVKSFSLADYQWAIYTDAYESTIDPIPDANGAVAAAKELWQEEYGESYDQTYGRPVEVFYDAAQECWLLKGAIPEWVLGAVPCALIRSDGTVLALWWD